MCFLCGGPCHHDFEGVWDAPEQSGQDEQAWGEQPLVEGPEQEEYGQEEPQNPMFHAYEQGPPALTPAQAAQLQVGYYMPSQPNTYNPQGWGDQGPIPWGHPYQAPVTPYTTPVDTQAPPVIQHAFPYMGTNMDQVTQDLMVYDAFWRQDFTTAPSVNEPFAPEGLQPRSIRGGHSNVRITAGMTGPASGGRPSQSSVAGEGPQIQVARQEEGYHRTLGNQPPSSPSQPGLHPAWREIEDPQATHRGLQGRRAPSRQPPAELPPTWVDFPGLAATTSRQGLQEQQPPLYPLSAGPDPGWTGLETHEDIVPDIRQSRSASDLGNPLYGTFQGGLRAVRTPRTDTSRQAPFSTGARVDAPRVQRVPEPRSSQRVQPRPVRDPMTGAVLSARRRASAQGSDEGDEEEDQMEQMIRDIRSRVPTSTTRTSAPRPTPSRRRSRYQEAEGEAGRVELGADKKPKGEIRTHPTNGLQVWDPTLNTWHNAVYHDAIRGVLLEAANRQGQYLFPRKSGRHQLDRTAFHRGQQRWGAHRPAGWDNIYDRVLTRLERRDYEPGPPYNERDPGYMMHGDRVVIDSDNRPVIDWPILPVTLSSLYEGEFIEAVRRICRGIQPQDLWARMPQPRSGKKLGLTALTNRQKKVREDNGLISWTGRGGSDKLRQAVLSRLSRQDRANNTTRNFRGLTRGELEAAKAKNKNSAASQSKSRTHQARIAREKAAKDELDRRARSRQEGSEEDEEEEQTEDEEEEEEYHEGERRDVGSDSDSDADAEGDTDDEALVD